MPTFNVSGKTIEVNDEGFLTSRDDWSPEVAEHLAEGSGLTLTARHWDVIRFCRDDHKKTGKSPGLRRIKKVGGIETKEMYALFPGGPGKLAAKVAGLEKPTGCV